MMWRRRPPRVKTFSKHNGEPRCLQASKIERARRSGPEGGEDEEEDKEEEEPEGKGKGGKRWTGHVERGIRQEVGGSDTCHLQLLHEGETRRAYTQNPSASCTFSNCFFLSTNVGCAKKIEVERPQYAYTRFMSCSVTSLSSCPKPPTLGFVVICSSFFTLSPISTTTVAPFPIGESTAVPSAFVMTTFSFGTISVTMPSAFETNMLTLLRLPPC